MFFNEEIFGIVFINQMAIGIIGNLLLLYILIFSRDYKGKPIDLILIHLSIINILLLLFKGISRTLTLFGIMHFLKDIGCKIMVYLDRVFRILSFINVCLLSSFQAITISSNSSVCVMLKAKAIKYIIPFFILSWILTLLTEAITPIYMIILINSSSFMNSWNWGYCVFSIQATNAFNIILWKAFHDVVWFGLTICNSVYIIFIMQSHHKRVLHIHSTSFFPGISPEIKATKTVMILVSSFIFFHLVSFICFLITMSSSRLTSSRMMHISAFMTGCFPTLCPFVLITSISKVSRTHFSE
ncbi:vomeronasal type-1 receptor 4-like [Gracilinanus agilis]|uniref:vomeronasal type-1 receptor 4-like n=1 Tax=Gracilinanus agilis TaxID=191870 RepID=UPI001CFD0A29|nr:vomeronasal type-1 receptor 4-like [Gracilinanus agilis]